MIFNLSKPVKSADQEYTSFDIREPTIEDICELNYPYTINGDGEPIFNAKIVLKYLVKLSSLPPSTCKKISFGDLERFKWALSSFFMDSPKQASDILENLLK